MSGIGGLIEQNTPFFTVKTLVAKLLHIDNSKNMHEREQLLLNHVTDPDMRELLPLLNDLLVLKVALANSQCFYYRHNLLLSSPKHLPLQNLCILKTGAKPFTNYYSFEFIRYHVCFMSSSFAILTHAGGINETMCVWH